MAFNSGSYARTVESQDDATVTANIMAVLRKLYGNNIPSPTQVHFNMSWELLCSSCIICNHMWQTLE
jgi:hypothetical protein